ncbi:MAG: hypothetical protein RSA22_11610 [Acinetobacter sp.]
MFKVGEAVVLKNSSQNKVMKIQANNDEFIRAYWSKGEYSFAHESNFRHATPEEIEVGHRIDHFVDANNMVDMGEDSHIENHISKNCKVINYD